MRKVPFEGIGPQPPETVINNLRDYSDGQIKDAVDAHARELVGRIGIDGRTASRNRLLAEVAIHDMWLGTDILGGLSLAEKTHFLTVGKEVMDSEMAQLRTTNDAFVRKLDADQPSIQVIDLEGGRQVRIIDLPDRSSPEVQEENRNLGIGDPYFIESDFSPTFPQDPEEIRRLASLIAAERHFPLTENAEYDIREEPQPTIEEGETGNEQ
ncbi:MAG TPA: hypothetical protein VFZ58_01560 [Candidatus Saccharimonadales bacterium]